MKNYESDKILMTFELWKKSGNSYEKIKEIDLKKSYKQFKIHIDKDTDYYIYLGGVDDCCGNLEIGSQGNLYDTWEGIEIPLNAQQLSNLQSEYVDVSSSEDIHWFKFTVPENGRYEVVGTLKEDIAEELGLSKEVKIIAGAGDNAAAAVGTGTVGDGMCNISLGTSGTIFISSKTFGVDFNNALHSFDHADGYYHLMGCMLSAASCNKWWMDEILKTKEYSKEQEGITKLGENHVFYLPYLMGERSPHNDPKARATFIGMSMDTTREEMTQAVLEGVAFGLRDSLEVARSLGIKIERTKICGGGAKSPLWKKIIANVMNLKVDVIESEEGPGYGGAMLAAVGCGEYDSVQEAANQLVKVVDTVEPDAKLVAKYQQFREIYPALKGVFQKFD